jgi:hypothetical protein
MAIIEADCIVACNCSEVNEISEISEISEVHELHDVADPDDVFPEAVGVHYYPAMARVVVYLASGMDVSFAPSDVLGLENANLDELSHAQISPSGHGVCFPELHVDLYIPGLAEGVVGSESWLAPQMRCSRRPA